MVGSGGVGALGAALYFMRKEDERIREMLQRNRQRIQRKARRIASDQQALQQRLNDVESDLGRVLLLAMAVNQLLVDSDALSLSEITAATRQLDMRDGVANGKLDLDMLRDPAQRSAEQTPAPEEYLKRLEDRHRDGTEHSR